MILSHSLEDYLEAIWVINKNKKVVRVKDIMQYFGYKVSSVNNALKRLAKENLIIYEKYGYIEMTEKGKKIAANINEKHRVINDFFSNILEVDPVIGEKDACNVEHYLSDNTFKRFYEFIIFLRSEENECLKKWKLTLQKIKEEEKIMKLSQLKPGQKCKVIKINANKSMKQKFLSMGLTSGETLTVEKVAPLGSPIDFLLKGYHLSLRKEEADMIFVEVI